MKRPIDYLLFTLLCSSCYNNQHSIEIGKGSQVTFNRRGTEIKLDFDSDSDKLKTIEIQNKDESIVYKIIEGEDLVVTEITKNVDQFITEKKYKSFLDGVETTDVNDTLKKEVSYNLIKTREFKVDGKLLYLDMFEHGKKRYNALGLWLIDSKWTGLEKVEFLLKNHFPFDGELEFYKQDSKEKLPFKKLDKNYYWVEYRMPQVQEGSIKIDVEILPSEKDTVIYSIFTKEIFLKDKESK